MLQLTGKHQEAGLEDVVKEVKVTGSQNDRDDEGKRDRGCTRILPLREVSQDQTKCLIEGNLTLNRL